MQNTVTPTAAPIVRVLVFDAFAPDVDCAFAFKLAIDREGLLVGYGMVGIGVGALVGEEVTIVGFVDG